MAQVLILSRLYSGFKKCLTQKKWVPDGAVAFSEFYKGLSHDSRVSFDCILLSKEDNSSLCLEEVFSFSSFPGSSFTHLPWKGPFKNKGFVRSYLNQIWNDLAHLLRILVLQKQKKYDLIYVDRTHLFIGAFFALFLRKKVVVRYLGVADLYQETSSFKFKVLHPLRFLSYFAPFSLLICTKDGSPQEAFFSKYKHSKVPHHILLNGCNRKELSTPSPLKSPPQILYSGRLVEDKGVHSLLKSLHELKKKGIPFRAKIIGEGSLRQWVEDFLAREKITEVQILGAVPHEKILQHYEESDLYVSLNSYGNLSNCVLEALCGGCGIITYQKSNKTFRDADTDLFLEGSALFISEENGALELAQSLEKLLSNPQKLINMKENALKVAQEKIPSWKKRIKEEINLLQQSLTR